jgi:hypothetical protein
MRRVVSIIQHRINLTNDADTLATTVTLIAGLATDRHAKRPRVRSRSATRNKMLSRAGVSPARQPKVQAQSAKRSRSSSQGKAVRSVKKVRDTSQHERPTGENQLSNIRWSEWWDPLDFQEVPEEEAIARLNAAGYFIHTCSGAIYKADADGGVTAQRSGGFNNVFACRLARCNDGKRIPASVAWRRSQSRREYRQIGYWPDDHGRAANSYNLWRGWGVEPKQGDWSIINDHILHVIAGGCQEKADYILDWCAHMIQRPWEKPGVALVLRGLKGTGKTLLTEILARLVGRQNSFITADGRKLFTGFNWHLADKLLIGAEEAFFSGDRQLNDKLKHLLTGTDIEVEQKFGDRMSIKSMHRLIMTSNHANVVEVTNDERRFFVCDVSDKRQGDHAYFAPLWRVANGEDDTTLAAFMYELKTRNITNWKPEQGARNAAALHAARHKLVTLLRRRSGII